ncbi:MAG: hypothetical protein A2Y40_08635 [Candidatus Margulisbacteria bacterium GWF2_35_9]|nr:MAG: hypothetical protein A2Y40_08635 [Candidatus Margulisbacteria bacterium GWF2_35_9]
MFGFKNSSLSNLINAAAGKTAGAAKIDSKETDAKGSAVNVAYSNQDTGPKSLQSSMSQASTIDFSYKVHNQSTEGRINIKFE